MHNINEYTESERLLTDRSESSPVDNLQQSTKHTPTSSAPLVSDVDNNNVSGESSFVQDNSNTCLIQSASNTTYSSGSQSNLGKSEVIAPIASLDTMNDLETECKLRKAREMDGNQL